jgi:hypothetical protein
LAGYLVWVGPGVVRDRVALLALPALAAVVALVVLEHVVDGAGVWASVRPLNGGLSGPRAVGFALAGDFFDVLSPAGPVTSEPIMARFFSVATDTGYGEALGVRSVAKYVKSGAQVGLSAALGLVLVAGGEDGGTGSLLPTLAGAVAGLVALGVVLVRFREPASRAVVAVATPLVTRVSALYRAEPHDRETVATAVERFRDRALGFGETPGLVAVIAASGVAEQLLTGLALWAALVGTGTASVGLVPILVVVPLPQVASVVPVPASLGAYDLLLAGALVLATGAPTAAATAAVLVFRSVSVPFGLVAGGLSLSLLRGWRPGLG